MERNQDPSKSRSHQSGTMGKPVTIGFSVLSQQWTNMRIRGPYRLSTEQFFVFADKSPVKDFQLRKTLRELLYRLNLNSMLYDVHSFRIERTHDL